MTHGFSVTMPLSPKGLIKTMKNQGTIDYNRNNRIKLRNFSISQDFHDLLKTQIIRMLRQKHKDNKKCYLYSEFNQEKPQESYPDILMILNGVKYFYEIQKEINPSWIKQITEKYSEDNLIIVDLKFIYSKWKERIENNYILNKTLNPMEDLRIVLESSYGGHDSIII